MSRHTKNKQKMVLKKKQMKANHGYGCDCRGCACEQIIPPLERGGPRSLEQTMEDFAMYYSYMDNHKFAIRLWIMTDWRKRC